MKKQWLIALCVAACLSGCGQSEEVTDKQNQALDLAQLTQLQVEMGAGEVRFHKTEGTARAVLKNSREGFFIGGMPKLEVTAQDERTEVRVRSGFAVGFGENRYVLDLYLPNDQTVRKLELLLGSAELTCEDFRFDEISCESDSGSITLREVTSNQVDLMANSGDLLLEDCMVGQAALDVQSGNITANFTNGKTDLNLKVESGQADVEGSFELIRSDCGSGDLKVRSDYPPSFLGCRTGSGTATFFVPEHERGFLLQTKLVSGTIASEFTGEQDQAAGTLLVGQGTSDYQLEVGSGRIDLNKQME